MVFVEVLRRLRQLSGDHSRLQAALSLCVLVNMSFIWVKSEQINKQVTGTCTSIILLCVVLVSVHLTLQNTKCVAFAEVATFG